MRALLLSVALLLVFSASTPAFAEDPRAVVERGSELARQERYAEAISLWLEVLEQLAPADRSATLRKLGLACKRSGRLPESWHYLTLYRTLPEAAEDETAAAWFDEVDQLLSQSHIKLLLSTTPPTTTLTIPTHTPGTTHPSSFIIHNSSFLPWWFLPGTHKLEASARDHESRTITIEVKAQGDSGRREIHLTALAPPPGPTQTAAVRPSPALSRAPEWTMLASGLALGVAGGIVHGLAWSRNEELHEQYSDQSLHPYGPDAKISYDGAYDDEVQPREVAAFVLYGLGGAALIAGLTTWNLRGGDEPAAKGTLTVTPTLLPTGSGALVEFSF